MPKTSLKRTATIMQQRNRHAIQNLSAAQIIARDPRYSPDSLAGSWARTILQRQGETAEPKPLER